MRALCALFLLIVPALPHAETLTGRVTRVLDGDTLEVLNGDRAPQRIRLAGIDAPESGQPYGNRAKQKLLTLAGGQTVEVDWRKRDRYGRLVGKVIASGEDLNLAMMRAGLAWWYRRYADEQTLVDRTLYSEAEDRAREARIGLWGSPSPTPPWEFRHRAVALGSRAAECPCDSGQTCIGERGGVFCVRPGGSKKYLPRGP